MPKIKTLIISLTLTALLTSCSQNGGADGGISKRDLGTAIGALGGAFAGQNIGKGKGQTLGIAAGTLLGAYIGNQVGASLDRADMAYYNRTSQIALETNKTGAASSWTNPDSGNSGSITPTKTYKASNGNFCREFSQVIMIGGKKEDGFGTACRQPDGSWKLQN